MPATAGRVRMPANNRVHSSAALQTHGIWQSAIGYDPYAPTNKDAKSSKALDDGAARYSGGGDDAGGAENAYASFQGLLQLARMTNSGSDETRGSCKKCGRVGHLAFQCRNFLSVKDPVAGDKGVDVDASQVAANSAFEKIKKSAGLPFKEEFESEEEEEDEDSDSSDSDVDPEMEKIIAARFGKKSKKLLAVKEDEDSGEDRKSGSRRRGRSKKRSKKERSNRSDESESDEDAKRKEKRRRRHRGSKDEDEEEEEVKIRRMLRHRKSLKDKKRRRSHRRSDSDSGSGDDDERHHRRHKCRHRQRDDSGSDSDSSHESLDDRKKSRHRHREHKKKSKAASGGVYLNDGSDAEDNRGRKARKAH